MKRLFLVFLLYLLLVTPAFPGDFWPEDDPCSSNLPISQNGLIYWSEPNCPRGRGSLQILPDMSGYGRNLEQPTLLNQPPLMGSGRRQGRFYTADDFIPQKSLVSVALGAALTGVTLSMENGNAQISADPTVVDLTQYVGKAVYIWNNSGVLNNDVAWGILGPVESGSSVWVTSGTGTAKTWTNNGLALGFNPIDDVGFTLKIRDPAFNVTGPFSWEGMVWFSDGVPGVAKTIFGKTDIGLNLRSYMATISATGTLVLMTSADGATGLQMETSSVLFPDGPTGWYHVAFVYTGATAKIYLNGIERAVAGSCAASLYGSPAPFILGGRYSSGAIQSPHEGGIGGNEFYGRALTGSEIVEMYNWRR